MTDEDVRAMEAAVLATPADPAVEREWAAEMLKELRLEEQRAVAAWKMWKFLRDDGRMKKTADDLARVRQMIGYLTGLLG